MEAQRRRTRGTRTRNRISGLGKTTLGERVHVQTLGLNAETKMERHRADGEIFLLTFLFIGLGRFCGLPGLGRQKPVQRGFAVSISRVFRRRRARVSGFFASRMASATSFLWVKLSFSHRAFAEAFCESAAFRSGGGSTVRSSSSGATVTLTMSPGFTPASSWRSLRTGTKYVLPYTQTVDR